MRRAESFGDGVWGSDSLDDVGALLGALLQTPIAAAFAALIIVLFFGLALLGRTGAPSVVPKSGSLGPGVAPRVTSSPTPPANLPQNSSANFRRAFMKDRGQAIEQPRHYGRGTAFNSNFTRDNAVQSLAKVKRPQVPDLRLFGARSNASLERGPPGEDIDDSIAGRNPSDRYPDLGTSKAGLR
jgi:hypothetical protein